MPPHNDTQIIRVIEGIAATLLTQLIDAVQLLLKAELVELGVFVLPLPQVDHEEGTHKSAAGNDDGEEFQGVAAEAT